MIFAKLRKPLVRAIRAIRRWLYRTNKRLENIELVHTDVYNREASLPRLRLATCEKCFDKDGAVLTKLKTCRMCHCFMPAKVYLKNATCPLGRW